MFNKLLKTDFFDIVEKNAIDTVIKDDRLRYKSIFDLINDSIIEDTSVKKDNLHNDKIVFSNINRILGEKEASLPDDRMVLYTTHTKKIATTIANLIHKNFGKFVQMRSIIPNEEYDVMYNMRNLVKIYRIERYKKIKLNDLFDTIIIDKLMYFPAEVELIDVYHKLYLPNFNEDWPQLIIYEKGLYKNIIETDKKGGARKCSECKIKRKLDVYQIKLLLLNFFNNENFIFVGAWANGIINNYITDINNSDDPIQIISENDIEHDFGNILNFISAFTNYGIYYKKKKLYIPKDNRIFKHTIYIKYPTLGNELIDKPFLDIYNCGSYELIPFTNLKYKDNNLKIGNIYVQLRFLMIDLWIIKLIKHIKGIDENMFNKRKNNIFDMIKTIKKKMTVSKKDQYIGINFDEMIEQKLEISKKQLKKDVYYPELSIKKTSKYELIATTS